MVTKFYMQHDQIAGLQNAKIRPSQCEGATYGENLIARCSQVHDNFTMGVNRRILINLIYLFIEETYLTCANGL